MNATHSLTIAFRADASLDIGTGHVMRCITLADALRDKGANCRFICREHSGHLIDMIRQKGYRVDALPASDATFTDDGEQGPADRLQYSRWLGCPWSMDAKETTRCLGDSMVDWLIVDHYALDARWEQALRGSCHRLMVIDDLADRPHDCDLLLDQNLGHERADYAALVPEHCRLLIGPLYALLRPEFAALREYSLERRQKPELKRLLITMGGVDQSNATSTALNALKTCRLPSVCQITVVMGATAPWLQHVRTVATTMPWPTEVRVSISDMARVMANSDLAIGAAGSTSWERCCLGLPTLLTIQAENQQRSAQILETQKAVALFEFDNGANAKLQKVIAELLSDPNIMLNMTKNAEKITDGTGCWRVQNQLINPTR